MIQMLDGRSTQVRLDQLFRALAGGTRFTRAVTQGAFAGAQEAQASGFFALCTLCVRQWMVVADEPPWHGLRVVVADGSGLREPQWRETQGAYGTGLRKDCAVIMARQLGMFTAAYKQMLHVEIGDDDKGERSLPVRCRPQALR